MNIEFLQKYVMTGMWETEDLRSYKTDLLLRAQQEQKKFKPLTKEMYSGNKIQIIDFFCGAGGTSLGFAAVNAIIPIFDFLGGCDINKFSVRAGDSAHAQPPGKHQGERDGHKPRFHD